MAFRPGMGRSASWGSRNVPPPPPDSDFVLEELAQFVDDDHQAAGAVSLHGCLQAVDEAKHIAVGRLAPVSRPPDFLNDRGPASGPARPEVRCGVVERGDEADCERLLAAGQHDPTPRPLTPEAARQLRPFGGEHPSCCLRGATRGAQQFMEEQGERRLARPVRSDQIPRAGLIPGGEGAGDIFEKDDAARCREIGLYDGGRLAVPFDIDRPRVPRVDVDPVRKAHAASLASAA